MAGQPAIGSLDIVVILLYLLAPATWAARLQGTKSASDFLLGGRRTHPVIMAVSYGATFISTAAIVGFGGVAGLFGMSLLWLTFLNIAVGIFLAFVVLGEPTRRIGHHLGAHTFPSCSACATRARPFSSSPAAHLPVHAAVCRRRDDRRRRVRGRAVRVSFETALLLFAVITAAYVIPGGSRR